MTPKSKFLIGIGLWFLMLFIMWLTISSCSTKHLKRNAVKVDSTATSVNTYDRTTTIEEKGTGFISNPTPEVSTEFDGTDTAEKTISTPLYDLTIRGGKKGKASVKPKDTAKVPVPIDKKTTVQEQGKTVQTTNVKKEIKLVEKEKEKPASFWSWLLALGLIVAIVILAKKYFN